ncbi:PREDICTED: leucine-rich repeat flightless-interacting protein 2-like [Tauraco erythrolophus]|uniref:leucine-rich repeat flightless-interacting protein 2-like n=1 Tax=Tauraco erythrolophus TaxID=121530 RepID=UPI000523303B|nr:PREDICTED: leucine-rich repeat flightless-interacting protein 2-like [Tauraco erythrolophus]
MHKQLNATSSSGKAALLELLGAPALCQDPCSTDQAGGFWLCVGMQRALTQQWGWETECLDTQLLNFWESLFHKRALLFQVRKLKLQLEEERQKYSRSDGMNPDIVGLENGSDLQLIEMQRDANRQISEYKFKLSKAEQDITTLEQNIGRLEGQVARYKNAAENAEKVEDELKAEKRKLQRELRIALDKIEEMEMTNSHLMKRLEKMKANRTALLSQQ